MTYQVLAQKYRPNNFDEVLGQEAITKTIKNSIAKARIANAYAFCGPRGVGKTSVARLIAKTVNCDSPSESGPCNKCHSCIEINSGSSMDVLEIDGASNRGIDEIRTLRENVKFASSQGKYKVYIIDEVHMLTQEAFNALLKTLEEPPEHVKFIFATTEAHKVLATIMSRCQRFDFRRITPGQILECIKTVAEKEKIKINDQAALLIARSADGSMRDALVILDQMVSFADNEITADDVVDLLGIVNSAILNVLAGAMIEKKSGDVIKMIDDLISSGKDPVFITNNLINCFRDIMVFKASGGPTSDMTLNEEEFEAIKKQASAVTLEETIYIIQNLSVALMQMKNTMFTRAPLEVIAIKITKRDNIISIKDVIHKLTALENVNLAVSGVATRTDTRIESAPVVTKKHDVLLTKSEISKTNIFGHNESWDHLLKYVKDKKISVFTFLRQAQPISMDANELVLGFDSEHAFNKDVLEAGDNLSFIEQSLSKVLGITPKVKFRIIDKQSEKNEKDEGKTENQELEKIKNNSNPAIENVMDVFGGKIVRDQMGT